MDDEEFLRKVLNNLEPTQSQIQSLLKLRDRVRSCLLREIGGNPSVFMSGSFKKQTMIKQHYDLDMFIIWNPDFMSLKDLFYKVLDTLKLKWNKIEKKRVGWRIPYENEFHVDIIPAIQDYYDSDYSFLYNCYKNQWLKTSMYVHLKEIEKYNRKDVIKLLKLWKYRQNVPIKTFLLEIMTHLACFDVTRKSLSIQLEKVLVFITKNIVQCEFYDPANKNNIITEDLTFKEIYEIRDKARNALNRKYWGQIFTFVF